MRFENIIVAVTVAVIAVTSVQNVITLRKFELVALVATAVIMAVTVLRDYLASQRVKR